MTKKGEESFNVSFQNRRFCVKLKVYVSVELRPPIQYRFGCNEQEEENKKSWNAFNDSSSLNSFLITSNADHTEKLRWASKGIKVLTQPEHSSLNFSWKSKRKMRGVWLFGGKPF